MGYLAFVPLVACGGTNDVGTIALTHDACAPLALVSDAPEIQGALDEAHALWRDRGAPSVGLRAGATVEVQLEAAAGPFHGLYDDKTGIIYINQDLIGNPALPIVVAHELGHAFGLVHITDRPSVMNPGNLTIAPNAEDQRALEGIWGACE